MAPPQLADRSVLVRIAVAIRAALRRALGRSEPARRPVPGERPEPPTRPQPEPFRQTDLFMTEPLPPTRAGSALYTAGAHNPITAADAEHLLQGITGLSFADPDAEVQERLFYALNELAWWPSHEHVDELALEWIKRIYLELDELSNTHRLYGKALRRLRTICGRTDTLPPLFEVEQAFVEDPPTPKFSTGLSDVHCAYCRTDPTLVVALKTIRSDAARANDYKRVWRKEAIVWQLVRHPHIVPFLGILGRNTSLRLVSTWMANGQLTEYLKNHPTESPLRFIRHVISGLQHIHSLGIVHGDIKGANILVDSTPHARIADFGVAVASHYTGLPTQPGSRGTAAYKAPECIDTGEEDDPAATFLPTPASDVYATAVLIWELFAGEWPHKGRNEYTIHSRTVKGIRPPRAGTRALEQADMDPLWAVVERGWDKDVNKRCSLQDMDEVVLQLMGHAQCESPSRVNACASPDRPAQDDCCTIT